MYVQLRNVNLHNDVHILDLGPVYLLVHRPLIDLLVDLLVKVQRDLLLVSIYSSGSKSITKWFLVYKFSY